MLIGIIGAMQEEIEILMQELKLERKEVKAEMNFHLGTLWNQEAVIVKSGIGKVNAAVCTQILIDDFNVDQIINVGIAGGIGVNIYPGDVVIADSLIQHDVDASAFGYRIGQIPQLETFNFTCDPNLISVAKEACRRSTEFQHFVGTIVSGDQFIADVAKIKGLHEEFQAMACEMEGASIAQVCYLNHIPFVIIRSISDNANNGAHMDYEKFKGIAVKNSTEIIENMFKHM